ncbi:MAG TPA: hypothetical protein VMV00_00505 [Candidatus Baltobacteraceae bacterium]|nr:hypothetical protein [Candidatus Baltobacteraceae bacterium]
MVTTQKLDEASEFAQRMLRNPKAGPTLVRLGNNVMAVDRDVCIKMTGSVSELNLLTRLYEIDPVHTVKPLFAVLGENGKMIGYGMERLKMTLHQFGRVMDPRIVEKWMPEIEAQIREAVTNYTRAGYGHGDLASCNGGIDIGEKNELIVKLFDPLDLSAKGPTWPLGSAWLNTTFKDCDKMIMAIRPDKL